MFQFDSSLEFAKALNPSLADQQRLSFPAQYRQVVLSYPSDELVGGMVNGVPYNSFTFCQQKILGFYAQQANQLAPLNVQYPPEVFANISANPGPNEIWNLSYNGWGMDPSIGMSSLLKIVYGAQVGTGTSIQLLTAV